MPSECRITDCGQPVLAHKLCSTHRSRVQRRGWDIRALTDEQLGQLALPAEGKPRTRIPRAVVVPLLAAGETIKQGMARGAELAVAHAITVPVRMARASDVVAYARGYVLEAVETFRDVMQNGTRGSDRVMAAKALLETAKLDVSSDSDARKMTDDALRQFASEILSRVPSGAAVVVAPDASDNERLADSDPAK